jgi:hypothetical protein
VVEEEKETETKTESEGEAEVESEALVPPLMRQDSESFVELTETEVAEV